MHRVTYWAKVCSAAMITWLLVGSAAAQPAGPAADARPPQIPPVVLSKGHAALCRVVVGDRMPAIELPQLGRRDRRRLSELYGESATVVVFWSSDRRMAREQLADLVPDVVEPFGEAGVSVVGIAVDDNPGLAVSTVEETAAEFPHLLDADGQAFAQVGSAKLPRTYVLDAQGRILWFDIEYSLATRRELRQALRAVAAPQARPLQRAARVGNGRGRQP